MADKSIDQTPENEAAEKENAEAVLSLQETEGDAEVQAHSSEPNSTTSLLAVCTSVSSS